jgi:hypothetical protein
MTRKSRRSKIWFFLVGCCVPFYSRDCLPWQFIVLDDRAVTTSNNIIRRDGRSATMVVAQVLMRTYRYSANGVHSSSCKST